jgi:hypothetical protein
MTSLDNRQYFPCFDELPLVDEYMDPQYYQDVGGGTMLPLKHWCYIAEIIDDSLSHVSNSSRTTFPCTPVWHAHRTALQLCMLLSSSPAGRPG